jgi:hypothetical protein
LKLTRPAETFKPAYGPAPGRGAYQVLGNDTTLEPLQRFTGTRKPLKRLKMQGTANTQPKLGDDEMSANAKDISHATPPKF